MVGVPLIPQGGLFPPGFTSGCGLFPPGFIPPGVKGLLLAHEREGERATVDKTAPR